MPLQIEKYPLGKCRLACSQLTEGSGPLILAGYDKPLETALLRLTPEWLTEITTRFGAKNLLNSRIE